MSKLLYRIGKSAFGKPWAFIAAWILIIGIVGAMLGINGMSVSSEMKIEGTESQKVLDKLEQELPEASGGQASVLFTAPEGERLDTPERIATITETVGKVYELEYIINPAELAAAAGADLSAGQAAQGGALAGAAQGAEADAADAAQNAAQGADAGAAAGAADAANAAGGELPPYMPLMINGMPVPGVLIATDGSIALFQFQFTVQQNSLPQGVTDTVVEAVTESVDGSGITALPSDSLKAVEVPIGINEVFGLLIAAVVLVMTLGSLVAAGLPIITALFGVGIGVGGAFALSTFVTMTSFTPVLALMIGLAVGIDYALFIVNRQRRLIFDQGLTAREAAGRAVGTAGSAVFFAGLTVIIALCGLLVIGISFLSMMALVASVTVLLSVLIALTLLPALLGLIGERICSDKAREKNRSKAAAKQHGVADAWVKGIVKFRWPVILAVIVLLGAAAIPAAKMELGIPSGASANLDTSARQSYDAISAGFGEGFNGPLLIVAEPKDSAGVIAPEVLGGIVQEIQKNENVSVVQPMGMNAEGNIAILSLIPKTGPTDTATKDLVQELREVDSAIASNFGVTLGVTGFTAINIDMSSRLAEVFPTYIGVIVILSLIILLLVFRSILVPIKATVGFLLSVLATFGITTAVFQWGWASNLFGVDTGGPLMSFIPILVTGILYGLAMDYQVFLVSSMRESYVHGHRGRNSVIHGYDQASRVVVAAAVIMVAVFAGFVLTHDIMIKQIGFALALGILIDAFFVRMALVPAVMAIFGDKAWWLPKWLDRLLPNLDVEGDKLIAELQAKEAK
ncbi:MMPL family transporter [Paenibacillus sp. PAMC21692]|uniref:MMPL family transporter n=1 Tax=Paenibacillus sp. PAMC21692 TaxID=2762320 RepID=UPI00164EADC4|nr:MMPL family transporter [Paenibacillus sp. PAMC21692]QNK58722.1 MMPL family transporter [Paenibacillus sp. PAMC21692]